MGDATETCFICRKHRGEIEIPGGAVYQDELVYVGHSKFEEDRDRVYPGVLFVEPKRHVPGVAGLTSDEAERIGLVVSRAARALEATEGAEHTYVEVLGHHVPHLHVWLVPRYPGLSRDVWGVGLLGLPDGPRATAHEVEALCERVRGELARSLR